LNALHDAAMRIYEVKFPRTRQMLGMHDDIIAQLEISPEVKTLLEFEQCVKIMDSDSEISKLFNCLIGSPSSWSAMIGDADACLESFLRTYLKIPIR
jgi:hypothetical protein